MLFFKFIACLRIGNPILIQIIDCEIHRNRFNTEAERNNENESKGKEGLTAQTRRPRHSPKRKINEELIKLVMELRKVRNIGIRLLNVNFF